MAEVRWDTENPLLLVGWVEAAGLACGPAGEALEARVEAGVARRLAAPVPEALRHAVRDALRWGGYKPAGRGKPASEYLVKAAATGFPRINAVVDAANLLSLDTGLPISLLDLDRATEGGTALALREGREGEAYVFNPAGQVMDVAGLIGVARVDGPLLANPVKDSMATKTGPETTRVAASLYAPRSLVDPDALRAHAERLVAWFREHAGATDASVRVLPG